MIRNIKNDRTFYTNHKNEIKIDHDLSTDLIKWEMGNLSLIINGEPSRKYMCR